MGQVFRLRRFEDSRLECWSSGLEALNIRGWRVVLGESSGFEASNVRGWRVVRGGNSDFEASNIRGWRVVWGKGSGFEASKIRGWRVVREFRLRSLEYSRLEGCLGTGSEASKFQGPRVVRGGSSDFEASSIRGWKLFGARLPASKLQKFEAGGLFAGKHASR